MKDYKSKVDKNAQLMRANEKLVENQQEQEGYIQEVQDEKARLETVIQEQETKIEGYKAKNQ